MSFVDVKLLNSDFLNEPLNYLSYIDSIEKYGDNSYMFDQDKFSKERFQNILSNSTVLFTHKNIHDCLIRNLKSDDLYYFFKNNKKLGECLNMLLGDDYFSNGNFDTICEYMNMTAIRALNDEFLHAFGTVIEERFESEDALNWIYQRFGVDLSSYSDLSSVILDTDGWKMLLSSNSFMSCASPSQWFTKKVVEARYKHIWRTSANDYYDDEGIHYTSDDVADGKDITPEALELMKNNNLVTEEYLTIMDSAYQRLKDALLWFAQNESITALKNCKEILEIFCNDESCCNFLAENPELLTECLNDLAFANAIFDSEIARSAISVSTDATNALNTFIVNIQTANTTLNEMKDSIALISQNSESLYDKDPLKDSVNATLDVVNETNTDIYEYKKYISVMQNLINLFASSDEEFFTSLLNDSDFVSWAVNDEAFAGKIVNNEMMITALCANSTAMTTACNSQVFSEKMANSDTAVNAVIANESAMNIAIETPTSMSCISTYSVAMNLMVASSTALNKIISTSNALNDVVNSTTAMNAIISNSTALNTVVNNDTVMNAIAASSVAMNAITSSTTAMNVITSSTTAMNVITTSSVAMNVIATSSVAMNVIASSTTAMNDIIANSNALNTVVASSVAMNAVATSSVAMNAIIANTNALNTLVASSVAMNAVAASSVAREALYNNASVTESVLASSSTAITALKTSTQTVTVNTSNASKTTIYNGKAFVLEIWESDYMEYNVYSHGEYIIGTSILTRTMSPSHQSINKFASTVIGWQNTGISGTHMCYALIFKI